MHIGQRFEVLGDYGVRYWAQPERAGGWVGYHQVTGPGSDGRVRPSATRHDTLAAALDEAFLDGRALIRDYQGRELQQRRFAADPSLAWLSAVVSPPLTAAFGAGVGPAVSR